MMAAEAERVVGEVVERVPFAAKGEKAEWELVYDRLLAVAEFGDVVTYRQLDEVLGRPFRRQRGPIYRANKHLGAMRHRCLDAVANVGYRVIAANEHIKLAERYKEKGRHQFSAMIRVGQATDLQALTAPELARWDQQTRINATLAAVAMAHEQRLARIEAALQRHDERLETVELLGGTRRG